MKVVNEAQVQFGRNLGLDLAGKTVGVAQAMIEDAIDTQFYGRNDLSTPSSKQLELAFKFGHDISRSSRRVGNAVINDIMLRLNYDAVLSQGLAAGIAVRNKHDQLKRTYVISSIKEDGTVYFRGGNGRRAWARSLERVQD